MKRQVNIWTWLLTLLTILLLIEIILLIIQEAWIYNFLIYCAGMVLCCVLFDGIVIFCITLFKFFKEIFNSIL